MNQTHPPGDPLANASREEIMAALFANMVVQQSNMALIFLGQAPHPDTGEHILDLETAKMFIDQLEMLEAKTKGNLNKQEEGLLKQGLAATRMAFVKGLEHSRKSPAQPGMAPPPSLEAPPSAPPVESAPPEPKPAMFAGAAPEEESRKKFTKKY